MLVIRVLRRDFFLIAANECDGKHRADRAEDAAHEECRINAMNARVQRVGDRHLLIGYDSVHGDEHSGAERAGYLA